MPTTALLLAMNLLVRLAGFVVVLIFRTIAPKWTPAFGIGFTVGGILTALIVRTQLGRWP